MDTSEVSTVGRECPVRPGIDWTTGRAAACFSLTSGAARRTSLSLPLHQYHEYTHDDGLFVPSQPYGLLHIPFSAQKNVIVPFPLGHKSETSLMVVMDAFPWLSISFLLSAGVPWRSVLPAGVSGNANYAFADHP
jgi:hypothetical protein